MAVIDAVSFFNELDLLELRLTELDPVVDRFVIVEATRTHKGDLKPMYYAENKARFAAWEEKIVHVAVGDLPLGDGLAAIRRREMSQRNAILRGITDCADGDVLLTSDCDEIPRAQFVPRTIEDGVVAAYIQKLFYYNFNTLAPTHPWPGTRVCRVSDARALTPHIVRNGMGQPDAYYPHYAHINDGGWHFSYFGGVDRIREKQTQFLHQELVTEGNTEPEEIARRVAAGEDVWGRTNEQEFVIGPATDLPYAVLRDLPKYAPHFHPDWAPVFHENWYHGGQALYMGQYAREAPTNGAIVEIGAWEGRSTITLAQMVAPRVVHVVDTWRGNEAEGDNHPSVIAARKRDVFKTFVHNIERLAPDNVNWNPQDWREWVGWWDQPIAFLHLDASHDRASVRDCLLSIRPFLVPGAILCGDDAYNEGVTAGVRDVFPDAEVVGERLWKVVNNG